MVDQNSQFYAILTNVGAAKQANADALGIPWKITQLGVGDANGLDPTPNASQISLINEWRRAPLNQLKVDDKDSSIIVAEQVIPAEVGGRWIREIALYDADGDMVAVANCPPTYKPLLNQGSGRTQVVRMNLVVSSSSNVELKIDPSVVLSTREWVTGELAKQDFKHSVLVATTAAITLSGLQTVDGVALTAGARVLVKNQAAAKDNGLYQVVAGGPWVRSADADNNAKVTPGLLVMVERGAVNGDSAWQLVTDAPITVGVTALAFEMAFGRTGVAEGTFRSVTVDKYGRVVAATNPTTVEGYGLTDVYTKTEVNTALALKAPLASPIFTGDPKVPTPPQFESSKLIATTEFVQRAIGGYQNGYSYTSPGQTIPASCVNSLINLNTGATSITLPLLSEVPVGSVVYIRTSNNATINRQGSDVIYVNTARIAATSIEVGANSNITLISAGGLWFIAGNASLTHDTTLFGSLLSGNGYQKLPSGLIIQWGTSSTSNGAGTWTFPIAFPNAALRVFASQDATGSGSTMYAVGAHAVSQTTANIASALASGGDAIFLLAIGY